MEQKRAPAAKYALIVEINQYLHTTVDVYAEDKGFKLEDFKANQELDQAVQALLTKWRNKAALTNSKKRFEQRRPPPPGTNLSNFRSDMNLSRRTLTMSP